MNEDELTIEQVAGDNAGNWMLQAIQNIDAAFADGYAQDHPELIAAMVQAAAIDSSTAYIHNAIVNAVADYLNPMQVLDEE